MTDWIKKNGGLVLIVAVMAASVLLVFSRNGIHDTRIDEAIYASQIRSFATGHIFDADSAALYRLFKPLYAIIGGKMFRAESSVAIENFILLFNLFLYIVFVYSVYRIMSELGFDRRLVLIGTVWTITAYPVLKYGFALGTDMSGWAFSAATLAIGLAALRKDSTFLLCIASVVGFLGAISKESGVLGLIVLGLIIVSRYWKSGLRSNWKALLGRLAAAALPAIILYSTMFAAIAGNAPSFFSWFAKNQSDYGTHISILRWGAVEASTFGLLWIAAFIGLVYLIRGKKTDNAAYPSAYLIIYLISAFIATLPVLLWPIFISRVLFVQFLWVVPLALVGLDRLRFRVASVSGPKLWLIAALPVILSVILFLASGGGSLFNLFAS